MSREEGSTAVSMTRQSLKKIKCRALRSKIWYKALSKVERSLISLTIKCVEKVRSHTLAKAISGIIAKILKVLENGFMEKAEKVGREISESLIVVAERWGNKACLVWMHKEAFIKFLGVNALNI